MSSLSLDGDKSCWWSQTFESTKLLMVELMRCLFICERSTFDCLVYQMLFIRALKPNLKVKSNYIHVKLFSESSHPCNSEELTYYVNSSLQNPFKCCNLHYLIYFLDDGVILSFVFTVLCTKEISLMSLFLNKTHQLRRNVYLSAGY